MRGLPALLAAGALAAAGYVVAAAPSALRADGTTPTSDAASTVTTRPPSPAYVVVQPAVIPTAATVGTTLTYSVLLKNNGGTGSGMTVVIRLSANVALIAAAADQSGTCSGAAPRVTCSWAVLAPYQAANGAIVVEVIQPGDVRTTVEAKASDPAATVERRPAPPPVTAVPGIPIRFVVPGH